MLHITATIKTSVKSVPGWQSVRVKLSIEKKILKLVAIIIQSFMILVPEICLCFLKTCLHSNVFFTSFMNVHIKL